MQLLSWSSSPVVGHIVADAHVLVAHQGGWDEMLMVIVPVGVFAALLYGANRRAGRMAEGSDGSATDDPPADGTPPLSRRPEPRNERGGPI